MKSEDPEHAVKFMMKVREEHLDEAKDVLRDSVVPSLREMGLGELLVLARRRQLEKLDPEGPGVVDSPILKRLLENAPPDEPGYANDLRSLHRDLVGGISGYAHAMVHKFREEKWSEEYEALRWELRSEENRMRVAGCQLDCYASYEGEAELKADTIDNRNRTMNTPHSAQVFARELKHLLFLKLEGIQHTVVHRALSEVPADAGLHAAQTLVPVLLSRTEEAEMRLRHLLQGGLASRPGFAGSLALRSRSKGFTGAFGWVPRGLWQHRGDQSSPDDGGAAERLDLRETSVPYELVTLWRTGVEARAAVEWLVQAVPGALGDALPGGAREERHFLSGLGKLVLRA